MEISDKESKGVRKIGDRSTSDVVVKIRTEEGRDDWIYCHSDILINKSKYFADRLSDNWPTSQILDSRNCVEVHCQESDFNYYLTVLRLLYVSADDINSVKTALGTLRVAVELGCSQIVSTCVNYLEAVPWEESEEEEILKIIPAMGPQAEQILARLQPVNHSAIVKVFLSAVHFATSSPTSSTTNLKTSAQEQLEYMLTEDDDVPLLTSDDQIRLETRQCANKMLARFISLVESLLGDTQELVAEVEKMDSFFAILTDLSWVFQILSKLEISREFVQTWVEISTSILKVTEHKLLKGEVNGINSRVLEVTSKVLEAIGYGNVVLPTNKRLHMVKIWLPFVRLMKCWFDSVASNEETDLFLNTRTEIWVSLESAFVSLILTLPSGDQAEILVEWLENNQIRYPDLTEAFEVWCRRSKVANRRLGMLDGNNNKTTKTV